MRELAEEMGLVVAQKADSQDICFVPQGRYTDIIERLMPGAAEPGEIVDLSGNILGTHAGIIHFTVGQRRGLGLAGSEPLYVIRLDADTRRVVVGPRSALRTARLQLRDVNWIGEGTLEAALAGGRRELFVKVRSTRQPQQAWLTQENGVAMIEFVDGEDGVAPGQVCAFYDAANGQSRVLGGGFIVSAKSQFEAAQTDRIPEAATARL